MRKVLLLVVLVVLFSANAICTPITYTFYGSGSGSLDGNAFTDVSFIARVFADTNDIAFQPSLAADGAYPLNGSITLIGIGNLAFTNPVFIFNVAGANFMGFGDFSNGNLIALAAGTGAYDLKSNFGPVNGGANLNLSQFTNANTSGGPLTFNTMSNVTFEATTRTPVPEPASLILLGTGFFTIAGFARRKFVG